jgi:hypothetical protein
MGLGSAAVAAVPAALRAYPSLTSFLARIGGFAGALEGARFLVRYLARHTGLPALVVAALLLVVGYRVLKRSARFAVEVVIVTVALVAATQLGWLRY